MKFSLLFLASTLIATTSCKKTIENWVEKPADPVCDTISTRADNRIIRFDVINTGTDHISGAIDDSAGIITVYLPHYYQLQYLEPNILIPDSASISPAAGELVPIFDSTFTYKVTGKSGVVKSYTIRPVIQQPSIHLDEISKTTSTKTISIVSAAATIKVTGVNILPSYDITSLHLIDGAGNDIYTFPEWTGSGSISTTNMIFGITDAGKTLIATNTDYWLEIHSYALKYRMQLPVRFRK